MNCSDVEFLELSREIIDKGLSFRFRAQGKSMFPFIRDGDILHIEPVNAAKLRIGDIIFYQTQNKRVIVHRLIKRISNNAEDGFIVKGDFTFGKGDRVLLEDILGRVKVIQRKNINIYLDNIWGRIRSNFYFVVPLPIGMIRKIASMIIGFVYTLKLYRRIIKKIIKPKVSSYWEYYSESEGYLIVKCGKRIIGRVTITNFLEEDNIYKGWWIFDMWIYWRYRALGLGRRLTQIACNFAAERGGQEVKLLVSEDNIPAHKLYGSSGFYKVSIPLLDRELEDDSKQAERRRIIMAKDLKTK